METPEKPDYVAGQSMAGDVRILLGLPAYRVVPAACLGPHLGLAVEGVTMGWLKQLVAPSNVVVTKARNEIANTFLRTDCTHLLFVDDDVIVPKRAVARLLAHDQPVVSAWYHDEHGNPAIFEIDPLEQWKEENVRPTMMRVGGAGLGCTLIRRDTLESLERMGMQPFFQMYHEAGGEAGEDAFFASLLRMAGIPWMLDGGIRCLHARTRVD